MSTWLYPGVHQSPQEQAEQKRLWRTHWMCPNCFRVLFKPPYKTVSGGVTKRYHSHRCASPMFEVKIRKAYPFKTRKH